MKILYAVSECMPFCATGGLAEVAGSLPKAIKKYRNDVRVIMPLYKVVKEKYGSKLEHVSSCEVKLAWRQSYCGLYKYEESGIIYYFVENDYYFNRDKLYSHYDDGERFAFFSKAIFDCLEMVEFYPDIIHANDHQTALVPIYLDHFKKSGRFLSTNSVFTIHNIEYQGRYDFAILGDVFDLDDEYRNVVDLDGQINLMKGAIVTSNLITTVSPKYAREITTPEFGRGLDKIIDMYRFKLIGILNGINYEFYNPEKDKEIHKYSLANINAKYENKSEFQKEFGLLQDKDYALVSLISRLVGHKGVDILLEKIDEIMAKPIELVVLGLGEKQYEDAFRYFEWKYNGRLVFINDFNTALSKRLYASSDLFLMPSKTEPCGLSQMIACRYGTLPIVHATGGLFDSITCENGFRFDDYSGDALVGAINSAVDLYYDVDKRMAHIANAMNSDFTWKASAKVYFNEYKRLKGEF